MTNANLTTMYSKLPNLVIGFHGCDISTFNEVINDNAMLKISKNNYDWLGSGIYFWENSFQRAYDWAKNNSKYKNPAVLGAIIDLGHCLNLTDYNSFEILIRGYELLKVRHELLGLEMPINRKSVDKKDILLRDLDCAVIQQIHEYHRIQDLPKYDSVRGVFIEGGEAYPGSEFREKTHIQLCITNPNCIKGFFKPMEYNSKFDMP